MAQPLTEPVICLRGITKSFPGVLANDHVDLDIHGGEIHALLGENGAGKSTIVKILYGFYRADAGEVVCSGRAVQIRSPHDARRLGVGMVFQNFTLIPALSVLENVALFLPHLPMVLDRTLIARRIQSVSERYGLHVDPWSPVWQLSVGEQQKVEVIKLLLAETRVLIFDEPTKVLAPHEIEGLMQVFANLRRDGFAVVFITHKLQEVLACADRITVMRRGAVSGTLAGARVTENELVALMFGTEPTVSLPRIDWPVEGTVTPLLELKRVSTGGIVGLRDIDLKIRPGEILGVAGVSGNGQKELGDVILGLERCLSGTKSLAGVNATRWPVAKVRASGVSFIPEDPLMAAVPWMSVQENMALGATRRYARRGGFSMDWPAVRGDTLRSLNKLGLRVPPLSAAARTLSGGNLQRLVLARELSRRPTLVIAFYPTRSLDVPGANAAREALVAARNGGAGVLLISEDLGELFQLSDRLVVLHRGRITGEFRPQETNSYEVGHLMTGSRSENGKRD